MSAPLEARGFLESAPLVPVVISAETGDVTYVGPQVVELLGFPASEWLEPGFWKARLFPDDQVAVTQARQRLGTGGESHTIDYRMEHADGRILWLSEVMAMGSDGSRLQGFLQDVTERKRQEVALWKSEERLRSLLRLAPDAMVLTDENGKILNMNDQAEALFDYRLFEVAGSSIDHLIPERLRGRMVDLRAAFDRDRVRRSLVDGHGLAIERSDGTEIPVEVGMSLVLQEPGSRQILCSVRDLTTRRRVEAQLRSSERRLQEMANVVPALVCFIGVDDRFRFVNDAFASWYGWERNQLEGRRVREVVGEGFHHRLHTSMEAAGDGMSAHFQCEMQTAKGQLGSVDVNIVPQFDDDGARTGHFVVMRDITREVEARQADLRHRAELAHVSRVATMGELAASIAHELNQPLTAIVANAQAARRLLWGAAPDTDEVAEALDDIVADGRRAGEVITSMRQLLQRGEIQEEQIEVPKLVSEVIELLRSEAIGRGVQLAAPGSNVGLPSVMGDPTQIKQVLLNLLMNAIEAAVRAPADRRCVEVVASRHGSEIEIAVSDGGPGLPSNSEELFQPFVSYRPGGLGMGLAISRTIVEAHGGRLWAEARQPVGAIFKFRVPV
jgi:PAS domain S-box-containing protein